MPQHRKALVQELNKRRGELSSEQVVMLDELNKRFSIRDDTTQTVPKVAVAQEPTKEITARDKIDALRSGLGGVPLPGFGVFNIPGVTEFAIGAAETIVPDFLLPNKTRETKRELFETAKEASKKTTITGQIAGFAAPGGVALKGAKIVSKATKLPKAIERLSKVVFKSKGKQKLFTKSGEAVTEGVIADVIFSASQGQKMSAKEVAVFAAIDAALPLAGQLIRRLRTGKATVEEVVKKLDDIKVKDVDISKTEVIGGVKPKEKISIEGLEKPKPIKTAETPKISQAKIQPKEVIVKKPQIEDRLTTSARRIDIDKKRADLGLDEIASPEKKAWRTSLEAAQAKKMPDDALRLADEVNAKPRAFNDEETAGMVIKLSKTVDEHEALMSKISKLDDTDTKLASAQAERVEEEIDNLTRALRASGTEKGRALASQKLNIDRDMRLAPVLSRAKSAKAETLSPKQKERFANLTKKLDEKTKQFDETVEAQKTKVAVDTIRESHAKKFKKMSKAQKDAEMDELIVKAKQLIDCEL